MMMIRSFAALLALTCLGSSVVQAFQVPSSNNKLARESHLINTNNPRAQLTLFASKKDHSSIKLPSVDNFYDNNHGFQHRDLPPLDDVVDLIEDRMTTYAPLAISIVAACVGSMTILPIPPAIAAANSDPIPSAFMAWAHFIGILGVSGGLVAERLLIRQNLSLEDEIRMNNADGIYGLSALSLLISGYFRVTSFAKGWYYYQNEPLFWIKMSSVAILGALSFFPAIILFRRDLKRRELKPGEELAPLSDKIIDRMTTIINAELLALLTIPLFATLMARGVLYMNGFPWPIGVVLYLTCLGGAGFKYGKEAFEMMEEEGALSTTTQLTTISDEN